MRTSWLVLVLTLVGCAVEDRTTAIASRRDAFAGTVVAAGPTGANLGRYLAPCGNGVIALGSSGAAWVSHTNAFLQAPFPMNAAACDANVLPYFASTGATGGMPGIWSYSTSATQTGFQSTEALIAANDVLAAQTNGKIVHASDGTVVVNAAVQSFAWKPGTSLSGRLFGVDTTAQLIRRFQPLTYTEQLSILAPMGEVLSGPIAVGNFRQVGRLDLAVSTRSGHVVFIDEATGTPSAPLIGTTTSFGASLAVRPSFFPGLDGLIIGEPAVGRLHLALGRQIASTEESPGGGLFGAAVALNAAGDLLVGAPDAGDGGLVFSIANSYFPRPDGEPMSCTAGAACRSTDACAAFGTCVGGVVCVFTDAGCLPSERCGTNLSTMLPMCLPLASSGDGGQLADAGNPSSVDAGPDAGSFDSGVWDAGLEDAGTAAGSVSDSGVTRPDDGGATVLEPPLVEFTPRGCSAGGAELATVLIGLLLKRRKTSYPEND